jgi:hypothetical protein
MTGKTKSFTSLKSPILGIWFFLVFPKMSPVLEITTINNKRAI